MAYKFTKQQREEHLETLRNLCPPGTVVYTSTAHVSRSGMQRLMRVFVTEKNESGTCEVRDITFYVGALGLYPMTDREGFGYRVLKVGGCGMDMGFAVVYDLSRVLWRDNYKCTGEGCTANDHHNAPYPARDGKMMHSDAGYALKQRWL